MNRPALLRVAGFAVRMVIALLFNPVLFAFPCPIPTGGLNGPLTGNASAAQSQKPIIKVQVNLQPVDVQVKDKQGNDVLGLSAKDFTVLENGERQKVAFFDSGSGPVSLVILVDSSTTVNNGGRLGSAQEIAAQFMRIARSHDEVYAMDFTDHMGPFQRLTPEQLLHPSANTLSSALGTGSAVYDAIATALCHLHGLKNPRQAVIVISDGVDEHSRLRLKQLIDLVRSSRAQLFMIGLQSRPAFHFTGYTQPKLTLVNGQDIDNPVFVFEALTKESGAESFVLNSRRGLHEALKAVSDMLQSEYTLAYYPRANSKGVRKIKVKVDRPGMHVLARRFTEQGQNAWRLFHFDEGTCTVSPAFHPYPYESKISHGSNGLIYRDDFSDPLSGWPVHKDSHYITRGYELVNSEVKVGETSQMLQSGGLTGNSQWTFPENVIAANGPPWSDLRASVTVIPNLEGAFGDTSARNHPLRLSTAGLIFRFSLDGYYGLLVGGKPNHGKLSVELIKRAFLDISDTKYQETQLIPWTAITPASTSRIELSVDATGNQISLYADGRFVKTVSDDSFDQGQVGFIVSGPGRAIFRNLVVKEK